MEAEDVVWVGMISWGHVVGVWGGQVGLVLEVDVVWVGH